MEYAIKWVDDPYYWFYARGRSRQWVGKDENFQRWKTKTAADKMLAILVERELKHLRHIKEHPAHYSHALVNRTEEEVRNQYVIVEVKPLPPKTKKPRLTVEESDHKRNKIVAQLLAHGWKPNKEYFKKYGDYYKIDEYGFVSNRYGRGDAYLIDSEGRFAVTLKATVMTVHDGTRQFCKVISMAYNEIEFGKQFLTCGRIALKI